MIIIYQFTYVFTPLNPHPKGKQKTIILILNSHTAKGKEFSEDRKERV